MRPAATGFIFRYKSDRDRRFLEERPRGGGLTVITRDQVINDVIKAHPETIGVFNQFKVDSCCGGGRAIAETALADGIADLTPLLHALNRATRKLADKSLTQAADEIEATHHVYLKKELPPLQEAVSRLAEKTSKPEAGRLRENLARLAAEIAEHLFKEEKILFPTIRRLEEALEAGEELNPAVFGCGAQGPIAQMNFEHELAKEALDKIRDSLEALEAAGQAPEEAAELRPRLFRLRDDLLEHIRAEEEELFPRALELEEKALESIRQVLGQD